MQAQFVCCVGGDVCRVELATETRAGRRGLLIRRSVRVAASFDFSHYGAAAMDIAM